MRLDKFIGKASYDLRINVYDWETNIRLFYFPSGQYYDELKEKMSGYKVRFYKVVDNDLSVYVKERKND